MVTLTDSNGNTHEFDGSATGFDLVKATTTTQAIAMKVEGEILDLAATLDKDCEVQLLTFDDSEGKQVFWHSSAHLMAMAVLELYPNAKLTIGPPIEEGYYYDFAVDHAFGEEDLKKIQKKMREYVDKKLRFERVDVTYDQAKELLKDNKYKLEILEEYKDTQLTFYQNVDRDGNVVFTDLCRGPHVPNTRMLKASVLTKVSAAYWRGDAQNDSLQRIYGVTFPTKELLQAYQERIEEAQKRDHTKIGPALDLFYQHELVGQGLPLLAPKGVVIMKQLQRWIEDEEERRGYQQTMTPLMGRKELYELSGHWQHYRDDMFIVDGSGELMALRPMTDPFQFLVYKARSRSYRDLPLRYNETSTMFRNEASGVMHGLIRVRQFTLSEGHLICRPDQLEEEFSGVVDLINYVLDTLGIRDQVSYRLSKWDPNNNKGKYIDNPQMWEESQDALRKILQKLNIDFVEADGEAAFYGPKLDIQTKNVHGKEDTMITVQIDFALPQRYDMTYTAEDGSKKYPVIIHRTSIGCYERTMAFLIEQYGGSFPLWLSPEQVRLLPIADRHHEFSKKVAQELKEAGLRVSVDDKALTVGKKVRQAQLDKVNYILVIGDQEVEKGVVSVRTRDNQVHGEMELKKFIKAVEKEVTTRSLTSVF